MLDEFIEFQEYTCELKADSPYRMHKSNVTEWDATKKKGVFGGVPRALKIISRYAYYECDFKNDCGLIEDEAEKIEAVKYVLMLWCGFEDDASKYGISEIAALKHIGSWLPSYIKIVLDEDQEKDKDKEKEKEKDKDKDKASDLIKDLMERCKNNWTRDAFQLSGSANDENSIYFESIIAEAVNEGPLRKAYLVLADNPGGDSKDDIYDRGLKLIASIMLNKIPESEYASVDFTSYSNWVKKGCATKKKVSTEVIKKFEYSKNKIRVVEVEYAYSDSKGVKKSPMLKIESTWNDKYKPRIVLENQLASVDKTCVIFEDKGCDYPLAIKEN